MDNKGTYSFEIRGWACNDHKEFAKHLYDQSLFEFNKTYDFTLDQIDDSVYSIMKLAREHQLNTMVYHYYDEVGKTKNKKRILTSIVLYIDDRRFSQR